MLPSGLGQVTQEFVPEESQLTLPQVIHIQSVHMNYKVQKKIEQILEHLSNNASVDLIALEGADVPIDPDRVFIVDDMATRYDIADTMAQNGQITGAELFAIKSAEKIRSKELRIEGVENRSLYQKNTAELRYIVEHNQAILPELDLLKKRAENLESLMLSREVEQILQHHRAFEMRGDNLPEYFHFLDEKARQFGIEATPEKYPALAKFFILEEIAKFIEKNELSVLEEWKLLKTNKSLTETETLSLYLPLHEIDRFAYPKLSTYKSYLTLLDEAHDFSSRAIEEAAQLEQQILYSLVLKKYEMSLVELEKDLADIRQLIEMTLVRERFPRIAERVRKLTYAHLLNRIETLEAAFKRPSSSRLSESKQALFDSLIEKSISFYQLAQERDAAMMTRFTELLKGSQRAVIITGGFHSDGITHLLKERGVSYSVILPDVEEVNDHTAYLRAFKKQDSADNSGDTKTSFLEPALTLNDPGLEPSLILPNLLNLLSAQIRSGQPVNLDERHLGRLPEGVSSIQWNRLAEPNGGISFTITTAVGDQITFDWTSNGLRLGNSTFSPTQTASKLLQSAKVSQNENREATVDTAEAAAISTLRWLTYGAARTFAPTLGTETALPIDSLAKPSYVPVRKRFEISREQVGTLSPRLRSALQESEQSPIRRAMIQSYVLSGGIVSSFSSTVLGQYVLANEIVRVPEAGFGLEAPERFGLLPLLEVTVPRIDATLRQLQAIPPDAHLGTFRFVAKSEFEIPTRAEAPSIVRIDGEPFGLTKSPDGFYTLTGAPESLAQIRIRMADGQSLGILEGVRETLDRLRGGLTAESRIPPLPASLRLSDMLAYATSHLEPAASTPMMNEFLGAAQKGSERNFSVNVVSDLTSENLRQLEMDVRENPAAVYIYLDYNLAPDSKEAEHVHEMDVAYDNFLYLRVDDDRRTGFGAADYLDEFFSQTIFSHRHEKRELAMIGTLLARSGYGDFAQVLTDTFIVGSTEFISSLNQRGLLTETPKLVLDATGRTREERAALNFVGLNMARVGFGVALDRNWLDPTEDAIRYRTYQLNPSLTANLIALYSTIMASFEAFSVSA